MKISVQTECNLHYTM